MLIPQSSPGAGAHHQHSCLVQGYSHAAQVPRLKKACPQAFCQLEIDVECDFLISGQGKEAPGFLSPHMVYFQDHWKCPWSLRACVEPASSACCSCKGDKEIIACNLLFSFSFHHIKGILMICFVLRATGGRCGEMKKAGGCTLQSLSSVLLPSLCLIAELDLTGVKSFTCCY